MAPEARPAPTSEDVTLRGIWLVAARVVWLALFVSSMWAFVIAIGVFHHQALHPCWASTCPVTPAQEATLRAVGVSLTVYANLSAGVAIMLTLIGAALALVIFLRRSNTRIALAVGVFLFTFPVGNLTTGMTYTVITPAVDGTISLLTLAIAYSVFMVFPDGRFVPHWTWLLVVVWVALHVALTVAPNTNWLDIFYPLVYLGALGVQIYRYWSVSNARQRAQTRIVVFGFAVTLLGNIIYWIALPGISPAFNAPGSLYSLIGYPIYLVITLILPISFALAIQRFQLFDVDALINRTLVYGSLTVILGAAYFSLIAGAQAALRVLTGQRGQSQLVIVLSTLAIAALFQPLRRAIQAQIDQRFYRRKYDAARTLEAFGATLRSEVELSDLRARLVETVDQTMRPATIALWLRPDTRSAAPDADAHGRLTRALL